MHQGEQTGLLRKGGFVSESRGAALSLSSSTRRSVPPPLSQLSGRKKLILFGWYGGKFSHLGWLLPLLPDCHHYCEPFAGSAAVLLNRSPSAVETYNDLDGEVCNFFRVMRDEPEELARKIGLTPFSREEFGQACILDPDISPLEEHVGFMSEPGK